MIPYLPTGTPFIYHLFLLSPVTTQRTGERMTKIKRIRRWLRRKLWRKERVDSRSRSGLTPSKWRVDSRSEPGMTMREPGRGPRSRSGMTVQGAKRKRRLRFVLTRRAGNDCGHALPRCARTRRGDCLGLARKKVQGTAVLFEFAFYWDEY